MCLEEAQDDDDLEGLANVLARRILAVRNVESTGCSAYANLFCSRKTTKPKKAHVTKLVKLSKRDNAFLHVSLRTLGLFKN